MGNFTGTTKVSASAGSLFDYLADVSNMPSYFSRMTAASPGDGEQVQTTAKMPDDTEVEGEAWFRVDADAQHIEWGSQGPNDYHGYVDVTADGDASSVEVHLHTTRVEDGNAEVEDGVQETLGNIKRLVEGAGVTG